MSNTASASPPLTQIFLAIIRRIVSWSNSLEWHWTHGVFICLVVFSTAAFWMTDWDLRVIQLFYSPDNLNNFWPVAEEQPWLFFYKAAPILTLIPTLLSLGILILSRWYRKLCSWRSAALFIVLCFALGPGLTVNLIFKDHWGRPRPRQVVELGGKKTYLPPLAMGESGNGKSFPCGHSSVGFCYGALYFVLRKKRPKAAAGVLLGGIVLGGAMGVGRMAAGAHFFSDVLWSAYLPLGVAFLLRPILASKQRQESTGSLSIPPVWRRYEPALWSFLILMFVCGSLLAFPFKKSFQLELSPDDLATKFNSVEIVARNASIDVDVSDSLDLELSLSGKSRGFGSPFNSIATSYRRTKAGTLSILLDYKGIFTDVESTIRLKISRELLNSGVHIYQRDTLEKGSQSSALVAVDRHSGR